MKWTTDIPTIEGFYWVKCQGLLSKKEYFRVAEVYAKYEGGPIDSIYLDADIYTVNVSIGNITHFADEPIFPPQD